MTVLNFLFWNINGKQLETRVARLARRHSIDVIMLVECAVAPGAMLNALNERNSPEFELPFSLARSIVIYTRFNRGYLTPVEDDAHQMTVRKLAIPGKIDVLLAGVHLVSKLHWSEASQAQECAVICKRICQIERRHGHRRTVLAGDLNMNPFEAGLVSSVGFNATMSRAVARRGSRRIRGIEYPFFYNPMWSHFGDARGTPPGTYYHGSQPVTCFWNMFDQVLIRPSLTERFKSDSLKILDSDGTSSFLTRSGRPDIRFLPITCRLFSALSFELKG